MSTLQSLRYNPLTGNFDLDQDSQSEEKWKEVCDIVNESRILSFEESLLYDRTSVSEVLSEIKLIKAWIDAYESFAKQYISEGNHVHGWSIRKGFATTRIKDDAEALRLLTANGYSEEILIRPPQLKKLSDLRAIVGKEKLASILSDQLILSVGSLRLIADKE